MSPGALIERLAWLEKHIDGLSRERQRLWAQPSSEWTPAFSQRIRHLTAWLEDAYGEKRQARSGWRASAEKAADVVPGLRAPHEQIRPDA